MQDRFRFRAWNKIKQNYDYDIQECQKFPLHNSNKEKCFACFQSYLKNQDILEIEQCTGLKDKNGKMIYEGDVVSLVPEIEKIKYVVKWDEYNAQLFLDALNKRVRIDFNTIDLKLEVVGNINENPELLEGNK